MNEFNSPIEHNSLGVASIDDDIPRKTKQQIEKKMNDILNNAYEQFEHWLDDNDLEQVMGIIFKKGIIK